MGGLEALGFVDVGEGGFDTVQVGQEGRDDLGLSMELVSEMVMWCFVCWKF
jgi:hypothetical protein